MKVNLAKPEHEVAYRDLCALIDKHAGNVSSLELLAVASNMVGKIVALQDQRTVSPAMAMEVVSRNLQHGNQEVLKRLCDSKGGVQ